MSTEIHHDRGDYPFISKYRSLSDVLRDHKLAALGDAFVNFAYSLTLSKRLGEPAGEKVSSATLASALRRADLRKFLPSRIDRHKQADAAEALIVYAWMRGVISLEEAVEILGSEGSPIEAFSLLLQTIAKKVNFPDL